MSYQVLARKWRPRDFSTLVGQEHVVKALTHALEQQRLHHAWLFTGTRGVGKTTLARILAKSLNCVGADGKGTITAHPCGVCTPCTEIDSGRFVDYLEMDAASNRGVEEMTALLEKAIYAPSVARYKVYMIDEVHMLSNHAFNAMLKTLEEPPAHVKFILATTDPQKVPVTVLSRCLQFNLKQMLPMQISQHLEQILQAENIPFELNALWFLARAAQGSMRDALSLTDQAIAYSSGNVNVAAVQNMLHVLDQSYLIRLLEGLAIQDGSALLAVADEMLERSLSFAIALQDLASLLHKIALVQNVPQAFNQTWANAEAIQHLAQQLDVNEVQLFYQIANQGRQELSIAPDEYAGFTMTLLRMLAFRPKFIENSATISNHGNEPFSKLNAAIASNKLRSVQEVSSGLTKSPLGAPKSFESVVRTPSQIDSEDQQVRQVQAVKSLPIASDVQTAVISNSTSVALPQIGEWPNFAASLPLRGLVKQLAHESELMQIEKLENGTLALHLRAPMAQMADAKLIQRFESVLIERLKQPIKLILSVGTVATSAAVVENNIRANRLQLAEQAAATDPFVQALVNDLGMTIVTGSVRPLS